MIKKMKHISKSDMFSHWINIGYLPRWGVLLLDILIVLTAFVISYLIGSGLLTFDMSARFPIWSQGLLVIIVQLIFFIYFTYLGLDKIKFLRFFNNIFHILFKPHPNHIIGRFCAWFCSWHTKESGIIPCCNSICHHPNRQSVIR